MQKLTQITPENLATFQALTAGGMSVAHAARKIGASRGRVERALAKANGTNIRVERVRTENEFAKGGGTTIKARRHDIGKVSWGLEQIAKARDNQLIGHFQLPVALARAMRTDGALFVAYAARIAPQSAVQSRVVSRGGSRADAVRRKALTSVMVSPSELKSIQGTMANHGVAIGQVIKEVSDDGSRVDARLKEWPLEHVRWNNSEEQLQTTDRDGTRHNIVHADGDWVIFRKHHVLPWQQEACVLPGALLWAMHANAGQDWAGASRSHGQAKLVGELPAGVALEKSDGNGGTTLTAEALGFLSMLQDIVSGDSGAGLRVAGSKTDFISNGSMAWQVFSELMNNTEKIAARIYLGTDAILGSVGGAPGIDISTLFGVASTILQGDFGAIEQALNTGLYEPWTAINYGDSTYAPRFEYQLPDPDSEEKSEEQAAKRTRLFDALDRMRKLNLDVTQAVVDALATDYGVTDSPQLRSDAATQLQIPDTLIGGLTLGREGRAAQGLPPFGDERDSMTLDEIAIYAKGRADEAVAVAKARATGAAQVAVAQTPTPTAKAGAADPKSSSPALLGGPGSGPRPGDSHPHGGAPSATKAAARQAHFDRQANTANAVAKAGGYSDTLHTFLNQDRAAVSKAERDGTPNATSDHMTQFLREARTKGADYKGAVYRGTTPAELDQIAKGGANTTTWSVSKDPEGAAHFAKKGGVLLVIPKDHGAVPVDGIEGSNTFNEALIPKGSKWSVSGDRNSNGVRVVTLAPRTEEKLYEDIPPHEDSDIDAALSDPNPKIQMAGDGGNLELWGEK